MDRTSRQFPRLELVNRGLRQPPEISDEADASEGGFSLFRGPPAPLWRHAVVIPELSQFPLLFKRHRFAGSRVLSLVPAPYVLFRPEEEHVRSVEADVVPPVSRWDREMHDSFTRNEATILHRDLQFLTAVGT